METGRVLCPDEYDAIECLFVLLSCLSVEILVDLFPCGLNLVCHLEQLGVG